MANLQSVRNYVLLYSQVSNVDTQHSEAEIMYAFISYKFQGIFLPKKVQFSSNYGWLNNGLFETPCVFIFFVNCLSVMVGRYGYDLWWLVDMAMICSESQAGHSWQKHSMFFKVLASAMARS